MRHISIYSTEARALAIGVHPAHEARRPRLCTTSCIFGYTRLQGNQAAIATSTFSYLHHLPPRHPYPHLRLASPPACTPHHTRINSHTPAARTPIHTSAGIDRLTSTDASAHAHTARTHPHPRHRHCAHTRTRPARRVYMRAYHFLHLTIRAAPRINIVIGVPRTHHHHGHAHARPPLPQRVDPLPSARQDIHGAHSLSRQHPAREFSRTQENQAGQGAPHTRTFAAAAPTPAPDGAVVVAPIPVKV
ncbi:hypothetical protein B0H13DRAFT_2653873 [Mycena leptocephala]|nr:hypothetical protein B0H13DRAFT_2653873 [Mycena leptocephala]